MCKAGSRNAGHALRVEIMSDLRGTRRERHIALAALEPNARNRVSPTDVFPCLAKTSHMDSTASGQSGNIEIHFQPDGRPSCVSYLSLERSLIMRITSLVVRCCRIKIAAETGQ